MDMKCKEIERNDNQKHENNIKKRKGSNDTQKYPPHIYCVYIKDSHIHFTKILAIYLAVLFQKRKKFRIEVVLQKQPPCHITHKRLRLKCCKG